MSKPVYRLSTLNDTKNILKIISFSLAFFLWFFVLKSQPVLIEEELEINYQLPAGFSFSKPPQKFIKVYLEGLRATLRRSDIKKSKIKIFISKNSHKFKDGVELEILSSSIPQPPGVIVKEFLPKKIKIFTEKTLTKKVPVVVNFEGKIKKDFFVNKYTVSPTHVLLSGPRNLIGSIDAAQTLPIDLSLIGIEQTDLVATLDIPKLVKAEELEKEEVAINLELRAVKPIVSVVDLPIHFISDLTKHYEVSHREVRLKLTYTNKSTLQENEIENLGIKVFADLTLGNLNDNKIYIRVDKPKGVNILEITPSSIFLIEGGEKK